MSDSQSSFVRLVDKGLAVIIGLVSNFVFDIIDVKPNRLEISLIVIIVFVLWAVADRFIRKWLQNLPVLKSNRVWQEVLIGILDFSLLLGIFLVLQLILEFLRTGISSSNPNLFEVSIGIFVIMLAGFSIVHTIKEFT